MIFLWGFYSQQIGLKHSYRVTGFKNTKKGRITPPKYYYIARNQLLMAMHDSNVIYQFKHYILCQTAARLLVRIKQEKIYPLVGR
jgi:hypothetical protein